MSSQKTEMLWTNKHRIRLKILTFKTLSIFIRVLFCMNNTTLQSLVFGNEPHIDKVPIGDIILKKIDFLNATAVFVWSHTCLPHNAGLDRDETGK